MNKAATNIVVPVFAWRYAFFSLGIICRSEMSRSHVTVYLF